MLSVFILAIGARSFDYETTIFFTFWGLNALLKGKKSYKGKRIDEKLFTLLAPQGPSDLPLSKKHFFGVGTKMLKKLMKRKNLSSLEDLFALAKELGVKFTACDMTCGIMNISKNELIDGIDYAGVATFYAEALNSKMVLFI